MVSRQITSEDADVPVMAVVYPTKDHVGIINGGQYEEKDTYWQWNLFVLSQPRSCFWRQHRLLGRNVAADFCQTFDSECGQVISGSAAGAWSSNYSAYGDSVAVYGGGGGCLPGECGPPKY